MEKIWIDAIEFDDYGGFILDTQFVREMGQSYLLAKGIGDPVGPASVKFTVKEDGMHRFWIRTKNWCNGYDPDGIVLAVDGQKYNYVCGTMQVDHWYWEVAGDFELTKGEHTIEINDTTGWFGRFAAVIVTNDFDFTPSPELKRWKQQRLAMKGKKNTVTDHGHFDLLIVGGGVPGVAGAITAARQGLKVALVTDRPVLGGNGSDEASVSLEGAGHRGYHETGVIYEIKNVRHNECLTWSTVFGRFVDQEQNISLFYNLLVDDVDMDGSTIQGVHATHTMDLTEHTFTADRFIDNTGDGWLGYYAGADYHIGREAQWQYGESFASVCADGNTMSGCNMQENDQSHSICSYDAEYVDEEVPYTPPAWAFDMPEGDEMGRTPWYVTRGEWWLENRNDYDDLWETEYVRDTLFRISAGYYNWLKNSWTEKEKTKNLKLKSFSTFYAKRETRRLIGDYILTQKDYDEKRQFEDAVCYSGWSLDVHHTDGIFSGRKGAFNLNQKIDITQVPFRCLYSKNVDNLMMAGRCGSFSHVALGTNRVMITGATMAQATAMAAVLCKKYGLTPREVGQQHMDELQQLLLKEDQYIPHIFNHDPGDLARSAQVTATSYEENGQPENVINGLTRITDGAPHAWISKGGLPQSLTLELAEESLIHEVRLKLEMPFDRYRMGYMAMPDKDEMLTDFTVEALVDGQWQQVGSIQDNIQRLVVVAFQPVKATAVRINALKALKIDQAIIPEVRIY